MATHPNRAKRSDDPRATPKPEAIRAKREELGLTQEQAAELIYSSWRSWQDWERGERRMHPAFWELWVAKATGRFKP